MKFIIEQIAMCPKDPAKAIELLTAMGASEWAHDLVLAKGQVFGQDGTNSARLAFNYDLIQGKEFEVLHYTEGDNWMNYSHRRNSVSHLGMHCTAEELEGWRKFFEDRGIQIAQEVLTHCHSNPVIAGKRWYNYVIFDTKEILGVDLKFIVRRDKAPE